MTTTTVGRYLATRFEQMGLGHTFIVPGDYNLVLLDELLSNERLEQIGCCNELNAAYAAEGYARARGAAAVVTTFNVGAFSALNGVAGAYAERLPVIMISGGHNTNDPGENHLLHHTLGTHDFGYQLEIFEKVTCAAVRIDHAENAPALIDHAISTALRERKPAYIEIACNLAAAPCASPGPFAALVPTDVSQPDALAAAIDHALAALERADRPILLAGPHLRPFRAVDAFRSLADSLGCAVAVMPAAKGFFPEEHEQFVGISLGSVSSPGCQEMLSWSDLVIAAGPLFNDYTTVGWSALPPPEHRIDVEPCSVRFPTAHFGAVSMKDFLGVLATRVERNDATLRQFTRTRPAVETSVTSDPPERALTRTEMRHQIQAELDANTTLLVETGDAWFNGLYMPLPDGARFEIEMQWGAIGWSVPAVFGYAMGCEADRRVMAIVGDGAFQLTAQEIANMIRHHQNPTIFVVNNGGYVIETEIHEGPYNYFKNWDYAGLVDAFNAGDGNGVGIRAETAGELSAAIERARTHRDGPVLIECVIEHDDCTRQLLSWGTQVARANGRPPRPV